MSTPSIAQLVAGIQSWILCESSSHSPTGVAAMAELVRAYAEAADLRIEVTSLGDATGPLLYSTNRAPEDTRPGILILAHLDTVHPIGALNDNPILIEGDRLYGPGSYDMKAGIYLALTALGQLSAPGSTQLPVDFLMVPDEETGSHASREWIERYAATA